MSIAFGNRTPCTPNQVEDARDRERCAARDRPWVLTAAILGSSLAFIEGSVVNLALPTLQRDFSIDAAAVQWVVNVYLVALSALLLTGGAAGDRFGLRHVYLIGLSTFAVASVLCALSTDLSYLLVARTIQGTGSALLIPASLALISFHYPKEERPKAIGIWAGASALTTAAGPVLGGGLVDSWGWTAVFWGIVPFSVVAIAVVLARVPPSTGRPGQPVDYVGAALLSGVLAAMAYLFVTGLGNTSNLVLLVVTAAGAGAFFFWEKSIKAPMMPLRLFQSRAFVGANAMTLLLYFALSGALFFVPFNLIQIQGYSAMAAGAAFLPVTLLIGLGSWLGGERLGKLSPRTALGMGSSIAALGFLALAWPGVESSYLTDWLPGVVLIGFGMTLCVAPLTTVVMGEVEDQDAGVASGINNTVSRAAGVLAIALLSGVAVSIFSDELTVALEDAGLDAEVVQSIAARADSLAELEVPAEIEDAHAVSAIVASSYVRTFRTLMALCAVVALASAIIAVATLGRSRESN